MDFALAAEPGAAQLTLMTGMRCRPGHDDDVRVGLAGAYQVRHIRGGGRADVFVRGVGSIKHQVRWNVNQLILLAM